MLVCFPDRRNNASETDNSIIGPHTKWRKHISYGKPTTHNNYPTNFSISSFRTKKSLSSPHRYKRYSNLPRNTCHSIYSRTRSPFFFRSSYLAADFAAVDNDQGRWKKCSKICCDISVASGCSLRIFVFSR